MNQKNSLGLDNCFNDLENPIELFNEWFKEAKKTELNDPNALSLATASKNGVPSVRIVLLKDFGENGFTFYTNLESNKSTDIENNPKAEMCFHWKSLQRQVRVFGSINRVADEIADRYFSSRDYDSKIGAWASDQSSELIDRQEFIDKISLYKKKFQQSSVTRPPHWTGFRVVPNLIEFWKDMPFRLHDRLEYKKIDDKWIPRRLYP